MLIKNEINLCYLLNKVFINSEVCTIPEVNAHAIYPVIDLNSKILHLNCICSAGASLPIPTAINGVIPKTLYAFIDIDNNELSTLIKDYSFINKNQLSDTYRTIIHTHENKILEVSISILNNTRLQVTMQPIKAISATDTIEYVLSVPLVNKNNILNLVTE